MADVVVIPRGEELHEQLRHLFEPSGEIGEHSQLIAPDHLSMLRESIDASLKPAPLADIRKAVAVLVASFKIPSNLEDPPMFTRLLINDLAATARLRRPQPGRDWAGGSASSSPSHRTGSGRP